MSWLPIPGTPEFVISTILAAAVMWFVVPPLIGHWLDRNKDDAQ